MLVVAGYLIDGKERSIYVFDPHPVGRGDDSGFLVYEEYEDGFVSSPSFSHGDAYYDFSKKGN